MAARKRKTKKRKPTKRKKKKTILVQRMALLRGEKKMRIVWLEMPVKK